MAKKIMSIDSIGKVYYKRVGRPPAGPIRDRILANIEKDGPLPDPRTEILTPCWQWLGTVTKFGYAQIWYSGKSVRVNRLVLILFVSPPPFDKAQSDHLCHNKLCVNWEEHLEWKTPKENTRNYHPDGRFHVRGR